MARVGSQRQGGEKFTCIMRSLNIEINEKYIQYNFGTYVHSKLE